MDDKLIPITPATGEIITQIGPKNIVVNNSPGGIVNMVSSNIHIDTSPNAMIAVKSFSKEYYQLLVTSDEDLFKTVTITFPTNYALTKKLVPPEIFERCSSLSDSGIAVLKTFPAIICQENKNHHGKADPDQYAIYGYIKQIKKEGNCIKADFGTLNVFQQQLLCENAAYFGLNMGCALTDLNRSMWSVHKIDFFAACEAAGIQDILKSN